MKYRRELIIGIVAAVVLAYESCNSKVLSSPEPGLLEKKAESAVIGHDSNLEHRALLLQYAPLSGYRS